MDQFCELFDGYIYENFNCWFSSESCIPVFLFHNHHFVSLLHASLSLALSLYLSPRPPPPFSHIQKAPPPPLYSMSYFTISSFGKLHFFTFHFTAPALNPVLLYCFAKLPDKLNLKHDIMDHSKQISLNNKSNSIVKASMHTQDTCHTLILSTFLSITFKFRNKNKVLSNMPFFSRWKIEYNYVLLMVYQ